MKPPPIRDQSESSQISQSQGFFSKLLNMLSGQTLRNAVSQIFADSIAASSSSASYGETLREVRRRDPDTGHLIKEYYGEPRAWMRQFAGGPPRLAKFNLDQRHR